MQYVLHQLRMSNLKIYGLLRKKLGKDKVKAA